MSDKYSALDKTKLALFLFGNQKEISKYKNLRPDGLMKDILPARKNYLGILEWLNANIGIGNQLEQLGSTLTKCVTEDQANDVIKKVYDKLKKSSLASEFGLTVDE